MIASAKDWSMGEVVIDGVPMARLRVRRREVLLTPAVWDQVWAQMRAEMARVGRWSKVDLGAILKPHGVTFSGGHLAAGALCPTCHRPLP